MDPDKENICVFYILMLRVFIRNQDNKDGSRKLSRTMLAIRVHLVEITIQKAHDVFWNDGSQLV